MNQQPKDKLLWLKSHINEPLIHIHMDGEKLFLHFDSFVLETRLDNIHVCPIIEKIPWSEVKK